MGSFQPTSNQCSESRLYKTIENFLTMMHFIVVLLSLLSTMIYSGVLGAAVQRRSPLSASDGEIMTSKRGFIGNPIYRPYGFSSWGWGSTGYGVNMFISESPFYGSYRYHGFAKYK